MQWGFYCRAAVACPHHIVAFSSKRERVEYVCVCVFIGECYSCTHRCTVARVNDERRVAVCARAERYITRRRSIWWNDCSAGSSGIESIGARMTRFTRIAWVFGEFYIALFSSLKMVIEGTIVACIYNSFVSELIVLEVLVLNYSDKLNKLNKQRERRRSFTYYMFYTLYQLRHLNLCI